MPAEGFSLLRATPKMKRCDPRNWNSRQRLLGGGVAVVVALVIIIPVAVTQSKKGDSSQSYQDCPITTSIRQEYIVVNQNMTSQFNFTCSVTSPCHNYVIALYSGGSYYLGEGDSYGCTGTAMNKSCTFNVSEEVIKSKEKLDISCTLLKDKAVAKQQAFQLPTCWDVRPGCNCSLSTIGCETFCDILSSCLHNDGTRYQRLTLPSNSNCTTMCTSKWCQDASAGNKTAHTSTEMMRAVCKKEAIM